MKKVIYHIKSKAIPFAKGLMYTALALTGLATAFSAYHGIVEFVSYGKGACAANKSTTLKKFDTPIDDTTVTFVYECKEWKDEPSK
jgi:3-hydroxy-3-methylglutaryl CoA synthase